MIQIPEQSFTQQVMPYLVGLVGVLTISVGLVVKAYAEKIVNQLKANHDSNVASAATTNAKVDTVIQQTNGVNEKLQAHIQQQAKVIATLQANSNIPPGEIVT